MTPPPPSGVSSYTIPFGFGFQLLGGAGGGVDGGGVVAGRARGPVDRVGTVEVAAEVYGRARDGERADEGAQIWIPALDRTGARVNRGGVVAGRSGGPVDPARPAEVATQVGGRARHRERV